ncbi:N-acetylneuraminate synthase/N,N'-diacetyllegionaminate synthase [Desulfofundulus luciae]|uniref:N-acetylneuraminate synthase/N,N'-diacetyllegionaminate synthase n=1 Tax=Desulfofundulus luciae TaxID=74702 RepID=A0ABU0AYQ9_9FIRM|nr:N-acetylneuraminate synthase [Desulfofundulus luciae]MDQ0285616.1 N-acetylneuraminate synthase/N,N'-diacetyllegionaminate synthase [Desulfofundulus luciae]
MALKNGVFIIAEAGVNHNGDLETAKRLVDAAVVAGADAVKFQTFVPEEVVTGSAEKASYQKANMPGGQETQLDMIRRLALSKEDFRTLKAYCDRAGIMFLSTPYDYYSVDFLDELGVPLFKIPSGELVNDRFLRYVAARGKPLIISTGMAMLGEVEEAVEVVQDAGVREITLLHCTSAYPASYEEVNLRAMVTLRQAFGLPVGYSDHTPGTEVAVAAVALGARVIEKHFTLSRNMEGPDHKASLEPDELAAMVRSIRNVERALGDGRKRPSPGEQDVMRAARRSLVAAVDIAAGEIITPDKLTVKRPGTGIPPKMWDVVVGRRARVDIPADTVITWEMI